MRNKTSSVNPGMWCNKAKFLRIVVVWKVSLANDLSQQRQRKHPMLPNQDPSIICHSAEDQVERNGKSTNRQSRHPIERPWKTPKPATSCSHGLWIPRNPPSIGSRAVNSTLHDVKMCRVRINRPGFWARWPLDNMFKPLKQLICVFTTRQVRHNLSLP